MKERLRARAIDTGFEEEDDGDEDLDSEDDNEEVDQDGIDDMFEGQVQQALQ